MISFQNSMLTLLSMEYLSYIKWVSFWKIIRNKRLSRKIKISRLIIANPNHNLSYQIIYLIYLNETTQIKIRLKIEIKYTSRAINYFQLLFYFKRKSVQFWIIIHRSLYWRQAGRFSLFPGIARDYKSNRSTHGIYFLPVYIHTFIHTFKLRTE